MKAWGSEQTPPIFENYNLEDKAFRTVTRQESFIEELDYDYENYSQCNSDYELSSDVSESESMETLVVEVNNNGVLNVTTSILIISLPSSANSRIVADHITTSSSMISQNIHPLVCTGKVTKGVCETHLIKE